MKLAIGVMGRAPSAPGKTRLRSGYDASFIGGLQAAMLADTLAAFPGGTFFVAPLAGADACAECVAHMPEGWQVVLQEGADLGARIAHAFTVLAQQEGERLLVTGSDAPLLGALDLPRALGALAPDEVLLTPTDDGGYAAIGLAALEPRLFDGIAWSTERVAPETRARVAACGLVLRETAGTDDIDEPEDVTRLARDLAAAPDRAPHTAKFLAARRSRALPSGSARILR